MPLQNYNFIAGHIQAGVRASALEYKDLGQSQNFPNAKQWLSLPFILEEQTSNSALSSIFAIGPPFNWLPFLDDMFIN